MDKEKIINRFVRYVTVDTQSNQNSVTFPSTKKQWDLAKILVDDLTKIGMSDISLDAHCYVMATLPSNVPYEVPTIGFISHIDTAPEYSGMDVNPKIHHNYNGEDIILNERENIVLSPSHFKELLLYKGQTLITTDGTTLLGADDKAGVTEIITAMEYLINHPEIKHGKVKICFTPDEEIGRGAHKFDVEKFGAAWAYTMDGSQIGELEYENFNAASARLTIQGRAVHPGYAKGTMINSISLANQFISKLPTNEVPEDTDGYKGFFHLHKIDGNVEKTTLDYIIRDHDAVMFEKRKRTMVDLVSKINTQLSSEVIHITIKDQYYNMKEKVTPVMHIVEIAKETMEDLGIQPIIKPIRGGTDGSQLSYMGLPCPNIFAGGHNFHGRYEYVPVESMIQAIKVIVGISKKVALRFKD